MTSMRKSEEKFRFNFKIKAQALSRNRLWGHEGARPPVSVTKTVKVQTAA